VHGSEQFSLVATSKSVSAYQPEQDHSGSFRITLVHWNFAEMLRNSVVAVASTSGRQAVVRPELRREIIWWGVSPTGERETQARNEIRQLIRCRMFGIGNTQTGMQPMTLFRPID
jgi:hypothetical protein